MDNIKEINLITIINDLIEVSNIIGLSPFDVVVSFLNYNFRTDFTTSLDSIYYDGQELDTRGESIVDGEFNVISTGTTTIESSNGKLVMTPDGSGWGSVGLLSSSVTREDGKVIYGTIYRDSVTIEALLALHPTANNTDWYVYQYVSTGNGGIIYRDISSGNIVKTGLDVPQQGSGVEVAMVTGTTGCSFYVKENDNWILTHVEPNGSDDPLYVAASTNVSVASFGDIKVTSDLFPELTTPDVVDTFDDVVDTPLASHITNTGGVWSDYIGNWSITNDNKLKRNTGTLSHEVASTPGATDVVISANITTNSIISSDRPGIIARCTDNNNFLGARLDQVGDELQIYERSSGVFAKRAFVSTPITTNQTYDVRLMTRDTYVKASVDGVEVEYTVGSIESGVGVGVWMYQDGALFDNFNVYSVSKTIYNTILNNIADEGFPVNTDALYWSSTDFVNADVDTFVNGQFLNTTIHGIVDGAMQLRDIEGGKFSITAGGKFRVAPQTTDTFGDLAWWNKNPIARQDGQIIQCTIRQTAYNAGRYWHPLILSTVEPNPITGGDREHYFYGAGNTFSVENTGIWGDFVVIPNEDYVLTVVLKSTGAYYFIKGGTYTTNTLVYISNIGTTSDLWVCGHNRGATIEYSDITVPVSTINIANPSHIDPCGSGGGIPDGTTFNDTSHIATVGQRWIEVPYHTQPYPYQGSAVIYGNEFRNGGPANENTLAIAYIENNGVITPNIHISAKATFRDTETPGSVSILSRLVDGNNFIMTELREDNFVRMYEKDGGVTVKRAEVAVAVDLNTEYTINFTSLNDRFVAFIPEIIGSTLSFTYSGSNPNLLTETKLGLVLYDYCDVSNPANQTGVKDINITHLVDTSYDVLDNI